MRKEQCEKCAMYPSSVINQLQSTNPFLAIISSLKLCSYCIRFLCYIYAISVEAACQQSKSCSMIFSVPESETLTRAGHLPRRRVWHRQHHQEVERLDVRHGQCWPLWHSLPLRPGREDESHDLWSVLPHRKPFVFDLSWADYLSAEKPCRVVERQYALTPDQLLSLPLTSYVFCKVCNTWTQSPRLYRGDKKTCTFHGYEY